MCFHNQSLATLTLLPSLEGYVIISSVILKKLSPDHLHFLAHNEMCHIFVSIFFYLKMI